MSCFCASVSAVFLCAIGCVFDILTTDTHAPHKAVGPTAWLLAGPCTATSKPSTAQRAPGTSWPLCDGAASPAFAAAAAGGAGHVSEIRVQHIHLRTKLVIVLGASTKGQYEVGQRSCTILCGACAGVSGVLLRPPALASRLVCRCKLTSSLW